MHRRFREVALLVFGSSPAWELALDAWALAYCGSSSGRGRGVSGRAEVHDGIGMLRYGRGHRNIFNIFLAVALRELKAGYVFH